MTQTQVLASSAAPDHRTYALTAGTELLGEYQDSAYQEPKYLIQRVDGQTMQLPRLLYGVASSLRGHDARQIADDVNADLGQDLTEDQVRFLVEERLFPAGIVAMDGQAPEGADGGAGTQPRAEPAAVPMPVRSDLLLALRYRAGVIPASVAARIGGALQPLFARPVWMALVTAFLAVDAAIIVGGDLLDRSVAGVQAVIERPALMLAILGVTVVSGAIHEFGHITACRYGGARPGNVGVGLYIVWPALYSDVTDSYRLDRVGRLRTDLGGVYFDAVVMAALGLVYIRTGEPWLFLALVGMHVETAWQFLPSIRLDGYYILADLVGVPDLFGYVKPALLSVLPWRPVHPRVAELKPRSRRVVVLWVLAVVPTLAVWLVLFLVAAPRLIPAAWQSLLAYLQSIEVAVRRDDLVTTSLGVFQMLVLALPWVGSALTLWMLIDIVRQKRRARGRGRRISETATASLRRWSSLAVLPVLGGLLVARVGEVARWSPATADETALTDGALAAVHGVPVPSGGAGDWLVHAQLVLYARLTGALDRHPTALAGARELAVLATAVLVSCIIALVLVRRLRPMAVAVPLAAVLAMGPAVTELARVGPVVLGAAWTSLGMLLLARARHPASAVVASCTVVLGVATEPLLAVPLAVCAAACLLRGGRDRIGAAWWPAPEDATVDRHGGRHRDSLAPALWNGLPGIDRWSRGRWAGVTLLALTGVVGLVLAGARAERPPDEVQRTVLLLVAAVVVTAAVVGRRFRSPGLGTAAVVGLAAVPWPGAESAVLLMLVATVLLSALLIDSVLRVPVPQRPHPLLRGVIAVPALLLVVVGALFQPVPAPSSPHDALAAWITGPAAAGGTVSVPPQVWGDLVHDGIPPDRLLREGAGDARSADWSVQVGKPGEGAAPVARFGSGATALAVLRPAHVAARERAAETERAVQAAAHQQAESDARRVFGSSLAGNPRLDGPDDVLAALRGGAVDDRMLGALAALTADHSLTVAAGPGWPATQAAGVPYRDIEIIRLDGRPTRRGEVAAALRDRLATLPPQYAPADVAAGGDSVVVTWPARAAGSMPSG